MNASSPHSRTREPGGSATTSARPSSPRGTGRSDRSPALFRSSARSAGSKRSRRRCSRSIVPTGSRQAVVEAVRATHPYEEPAFTIVAALDEPGDTGLGRVGQLLEPTTVAGLAHRAAQALPVGPGAYGPQATPSVRSPGWRSPEERATPSSTTAGAGRGRLCHGRPAPPPCTRLHVRRRPRVARRRALGQRAPVARAGGQTPGRSTRYGR